MNIMVILQELLYEFDPKVHRAPPPRMVDIYRKRYKDRPDTKLAEDLPGQDAGPHESIINERIRKTWATLLNRRQAREDPVQNLYVYINPETASLHLMRKTMQFARYCYHHGINFCLVSETIRVTEDFKFLYHRDDIIKATGSITLTDREMISFSRIWSMYLDDVWGVEVAKCAQDLEYLLTLNNIALLILLKNRKLPPLEEMCNTLYREAGMWDLSLEPYPVLKTHFRRAGSLMEGRWELAGKSVEFEPRDYDKVEKEAVQAYLTLQYYKQLGETDPTFLPKPDIAVICPHCKEYTPRTGIYCIHCTLKWPSYQDMMAIDPRDFQFACECLADETSQNMMYAITEGSEYEDC